MTKSIIGLDIGGTKIDGIFFQNGKIAKSRKIRTPQSRKKFLTAAGALARELAMGQKFDAVAVACAGAIDQKRQIVLRSPNLRFLNNFPLAKALQKRFHKPVKVENDANCFLLGEAWRGAARGKKNVVALTIGTGVGGAAIANGELIRGHHGCAAELGHSVVSIQNNKILSLEDLVGSNSFAHLGQNPEKLSRLAAGGNIKATRIFESRGRQLGFALVSFIKIFDPELILLTGGLLTNVEKYWLEGAKKEIKKYLHRPAAYCPPIKISKLKHAGALGAISLFLQSKHKKTD